MLTWRYHLLSLVAVFLALALGLLLGVSLSDSGVVNTSQAGLVDDIQRDLEAIRSQNNLLSRDRAINLRFQEDAFPYVIGSRLSGKRIALVASAVSGEEIQRKLTSAIHGAGGTIVSTTILNSRFDAAALTAKLKNDLKADPAFANADDATAISVLAGQLAKNISKTGGGLLLETLKGTLVESASGRYDLPVDAVVLLSRADDEQVPAYEELERNFLLGLKGLAVPVAGCEPSDALRSEIPLFQSVDISSVDNIDSRIGQVSLVYVLAGEKGAFGIKTTADMLIPILRTPKTTGAPQP